MAGSSRDDLEARVARLERLLNRVLELLQDRQAGSDPGPEGLEDEVPREVMQAVSAASFEEDDEVEAAPEKHAATPPPPPLEAPTPETLSSEIPPGLEAPAGSGLLGDLGILGPGGTFLSRVGIALLLLSVAFFFKYSIDQGWLTEWVRLAFGIGAGVVLLVLGFKGASKGEPLGTALAGGGIATFFITGFVGHQWYELVSYPTAFSFLVVASALGIFLSLRSGLQALAIVGLIGALATPLLLTPPTEEVAGLALYVSLIVASVSAVYLARAWRAVFLLAVLTSWLVLFSALDAIASPTGGATWVVQGGIVFCALAFWLVPLLRARLRADNPGKWPRPENAYPAEVQEEGDGVGQDSRFDLDQKSAAGTAYVPWNVHLDVLSLLMPLVGIGFSTWLWDLSRLELGWVFLGSASLAQGVGWWISRSSDPEDSASTQTFVAILLSTVGLGLVLTGDVLYLAFIAEAAALFAVGARKGSKVVLGLGGVVEALVVGLFLFRLVFGGTLLEGDVSSVFDLVAIAGVAFIGTRLRNSDARLGLFTGSYLALLAFTGRELAAHPSFLYLAFLVEAVGTHMVAFRRKSQLLENLGYVASALVALGFIFGIQSGRTLLGGDLTLMVDVAALAGAVFIGTLVSRPEIRQGFFAAAYVGLLAMFGRELSGHESTLYSIFILSAVLTQIAAVRGKSTLFSVLGHLPAILVLGLFLDGMQAGRSLWAGDPISLIDLMALAGLGFIGTLLKARELRLVYLYAAYGGLLIWTGRELYPMEQGQALMSLAFGVEGTVLLVWGFLSGKTLMYKTGMATLLLVVAKVLLVDLAAVEPIWRVLLLFLFAVLFLVLSKVVQDRREAEEGSPG